MDVWKQQTDWPPEWQVEVLGAPLRETTRMMWGVSVQGRVFTGVTSVKLV